MRQPGANSLPEGILAANGAFMAAFSAGDVEGLAALYSTDAQLLPPGSDVLSGRSEIQAFWRAKIGMGLGQARRQTVELHPHGMNAVELSRITFHSADGRLLSEGKLMVLWRCEEHIWKLHREMFNSNWPG